MRSLLGLLALTLTVSPAFAQADRIYGAYPEGTVVEGYRDVNGDGYSDFLVGGLSNPRDTVVLVSGLTLLPIRSWTGTQAGEGFGQSLALGDVNGDRVLDIAVGSPRYDVTTPRALRDAGRVTLIDGKTWEVLFTVDGETASEASGEVIRLCEYHGTNGRPELFIGAPSYQGNSGILRVYDIVGTTKLRAAAWRQWAGTTGAHRFAHSFACGDLNGDRRPEIIIGAYGRAGPGCRNYGSGYVQIVDGLLLTLFPKIVGPNHGFSTSLLYVPDTNDNGLGEFLVGSPMASQVYHYDGNRGNKFGLLRQFGSVSKQFTLFGGDMRLIPDQDRDGKRDLVVGGTGTICSIRQIPGSVEVISLGRQVRSLHWINGTTSPQRFGSRVAYGGDVNGDGTPDLLVASGARGARISVASLKPLTLTPSLSSIVLSQGGTSDFRIDVGKAHAGRIYVVTGSLRGVKPGVALTSSIRMPLNPDVFMGVQLGLLNLGPFVNFLGRLDQNGRGTARWTVIPVLPADLKNVPMHYSCVVIDFASLTFSTATNFIPFYLR